MLFDKTPGQVASPEDEQAAQRRQREEDEARERWNRELEEGKRLRREKRAAAERLRAKALETTPAGRARAALESGATVYQLVLPLTAGAEPAQGAGGDKPDDERSLDHNAVLNAIESQGWRLEHANYVTRRAPAAGGDQGASSSGREAAAEDIVALYIFRRSG